jgi:hypothetical protein
MGFRSDFRPALVTPLALSLAAVLVACGGDSHWGPRTTALPVTTVATADVNGDGKVDILDTLDDARSNLSGWLSVRVQDATRPGSYLAPVASDAGVNPGAFAVAPLTPGGRPGLVVVNGPINGTSPSGFGVSVLYPDPGMAGGFLAPLPLAAAGMVPLGVAVGDLNGDTWPDVVVAVDGQPTLLLFTQTTAGQAFNAPVSLTVGGIPTAVAVADLDGDGLPDLVATTEAGTVSVLLQDKAHPGTFLPAVDVPVGAFPVALQVADVNGDGLPDLVVADYGTPEAPTTKGVSVLLNEAGAPGTFGVATTLEVGDAFAASVAVADLDGDGRPDIVVACSGLPGEPGSVAVLLQDGTQPGTFKAAVRYRGVYGPTSVAIADIDGDGLPDLVLGDGWLYVRFQASSPRGVFGEPQPYLQ